MPNEFITAFNDGNTAFGVSANEDFSLIRTGVVGTYSALSIDDLTVESAVAPGGTKNENNVILFITPAVKTASSKVEGSILGVRDKGGRIVSFADSGDNAVAVVCTGTGAKL